MVWFRVGLKGTDHSKYLELPSENRRLFIEEWLQLAYLEIDEFWIDEMMRNIKNSDTAYPMLCEVEMIERPPRKYAEFVVAQCEREIQNIRAKQKLFQSTLT